MVRFPINLEMSLTQSTKENDKIQKGVYYYATTKDSFFLQSVLHTDSTTTGKRKSFPNEIKIYGLASFTFFFSVQQFKVHTVAMLFLTDLPRVRQNYQDILLLHIQLFFQHIIDFEQLYFYSYLRNFQTCFYFSVTAKNNQIVCKYWIF